MTGIFIESGNLEGEADRQRKDHVKIQGQCHRQGREQLRFQKLEERPGADCHNPQKKPTLPTS